MPNFSLPTAIVASVGIVGVGVLAYLKVPVETVAGYGAAFIGIAAALEKLVKPTGKSE